LHYPGLLPRFSSRFYHSLAEAQIRATTDHKFVSNFLAQNCFIHLDVVRIATTAAAASAARASAALFARYVPYLLHGNGTNHPMNVSQMKDTFNTVDFCSTPDCLAHRVMRDDMQKAHLPHHDLMKVRRVVHTRLFGKTYREAKEALKHARTFFKPTQPGMRAQPEAPSESESDTEDEEGHPPVIVQAKRMSRIPTLAVAIPNSSRRDSTYIPGAENPLSMYPTSAVSTAPNAGFSGPLCCACDKPVSQPCWYCVQCAGSTFICWECEAKDDATAVVFGEHDYHAHDLVRVQPLVEDQEFSVEERLGELEERFGRHEKKMEERLGRMEQMLEQLLSRLATGTA
jgi:hypothetical protein